MTTTRKNGRNFNNSDAGYGVIMILIGSVFLLLLFWGYYTHYIARVEPTENTNFVAGILHGFYIVPSFILSLSDSSIAVYQTPNDGGWYVTGFSFGLFGALGIFIPLKHRVENEI